MKSILKFFTTLLFIAITTTKIIPRATPRKLHLDLTPNFQPQQSTINQPQSERNLFSPMSPMGLMPGLGMGFGMGMMGLGMNMGLNSMMPHMNDFGGSFNNQGGFGMGPNNLGNISTEQTDTENLTEDELKRFNEAHQLLNNPKLDVKFAIPGVDDWHSGSHVVSTECEDVKKEAMEIANIITRRQNALIYKEIMKYVMKSKYLIGNAEISITQALKDKVSNIMKHFEDIDDKKFNSISPTEDILNNKRSSVEEEIVHDSDQNEEIVINEHSMTDAGPEIEDSFQQK